MTASYLDVVLSAVLIFAVPGVTAFWVKRIIRDLGNRFERVELKQTELREKILPTDYLQFKVYIKDMNQWSERCGREMNHMQSTSTLAIERIDKNIDRIFELLDDMRNRANKRTRSTD